MLLVPAVVLAAGESSRMGRPKALLPADRQGTTFVRRLATTLYAGGCAEVIVVVGFEPETIVAELNAIDDVPVRVVVNRRWRDGQLISLLTALDVVDRPGVAGIALALVDAPFVSADTIARLLAVHRDRGVPIVRPVHAGRHGHPVIFDRSLFGDLRRADPAEGARSVVHAHAADVVDVPVEDEGAFHDIDTPADYARLDVERRT